MHINCVEIVKIIFLGYKSDSNLNFGSIIGRVCNKISCGQFMLNGKIIPITRNFNRRHYADGGNIGFSRVVWDSKIIDGTKVVMSHVSPDQNEGFPGTLLVQVIFELASDNKFHIEMRATTTKLTPINLTSNSFFNLAGHHSGDKELKKHFVTINADCFTLVDVQNLPTGEIKSVKNRKIDLQTPKCLGDLMPIIPGEGFDHNYCINSAVDQDLCFAARVIHPKTGRVLEMYTNQPGLQFYTGQRLTDPNSTYHQPVKTSQPLEACCKPGEYPCSKLGFECNDGRPCNPRDPNLPCCTPGDYPCRKLGFECNFGQPCQAQADNAPCCETGDYPCTKLGFDCNMDTACIGTPFSECRDQSPKIIRGKNGVFYRKNAAFCINSQNYPDSVNHANFPSSFLYPGEIYCHKIVYKFWAMSEIPPVIPVRNKFYK